jgi:hypothetical protein
LIKIGANITSAQFVDSAVPDNVNRVVLDSGTFVDVTGAQLVWERVSPFSPSLTNFCRAGKVSVLYSYTLITS